MSFGPPRQKNLIREHTTEIRVREIPDDQYQSLNRHFKPKNINEKPKETDLSPSKPQKRKFQAAKSTKSQELKQIATRKKLDNYEMQKKTEELQIQMRQENIEKQKERISSTVRRTKCLYSSMGLLIKRDRIKATERVYNEWLILKDQEHEFRQSLLAKMVGDMTTFSIERELTALQRAEKEAAQKALEEGNQQQDPLNPNPEAPPASPK